MDSAYIKFNGGIWSEVLKGRYDLGNYKSAARTCENFIPTRYGQVEKRAGTKHLGYAKNNDKACVLHSFQFSVNTKFMLEFGDRYVRFWSNDQQVMSGGFPLEVSTPYLEEELHDLQIRAVNDVVYIVHPNYYVAKLTRLADNNWTYGGADMSLPFVDPDVNSSTVTLQASALTGNGISITASERAFEPDHVGSILRLKHLTDTTSIAFYDGYLTSAPFDPATDNFPGDRVYRTDGVGSPQKQYHYTCTTFYPAGTTTNTEPPNQYFDDGVVIVNPIYVSGRWEVKTTGIWNGIYEVQRSIDNGNNWNTLKILTSANDSNYLLEEDEQGDGVLIRILGVAKDFSSFQWTLNNLTVFSTAQYGNAIVTVSNDAAGKVVLADVLSTIYSTEPTLSWQESAFSPRQGFPRAISLFDNRLVVAGTKKKPQSFFYSRINSYDDFLAESTLADAPFYVETLSEDQSAVQWITAQRELFVGTASVEGVLITRKQDIAQSSENLPIVRWNESMGSAHRPPLPLHDSLLILQRGRTALNMLAYSLDKDGYIGEEVSLLCPDLFSSGVIQMARLREPYTGVFTVQEDGTLCHMIYEPKLQVTGWCKYTTQGGEFESVQTLPSSGNESTNEDEVWCVVKRTINGVTRRHIEHFALGNVGKQRSGDADNMWYLDAAVKTTGSGLTTITGLDHLEGETVCVLADGIKGSYTVASGSITLSVAADTVIVGLPVTSTFEPFDLETEESVGKRKQLYQTKMMIWRSLGGSIASDGKDYQDLIYQTAGETMDESIPLKDGYSEVFHESSHGRQKYWRVKHDEPYPFTLQAVVQTFTVSKH